MFPKIKSWGLSRQAIVWIRSAEKGIHARPRAFALRQSATSQSPRDGGLRAAFLGDRFQKPYPDVGAKPPLYLFHCRRMADAENRANCGLLIGLLKPNFLQLRLRQQASTFMAKASKSRRDSCESKVGEGGNIHGKV